MEFCLGKIRTTPLRYITLSLVVLVVLYMYIVFTQIRVPFGGVPQPLPGSEKSKSESTGGVRQLFPEYSVYVNKLLKCLDTTNLTTYFHQENLLSIAELNVKNYLDAIHKFIPNKFNNTLPNHCWNSAARLNNIGTAVISGHTNGTEFRVNRTDIQKWTLNTVPRFSKNTRQRRYFLPISCIPELFLLGFHKCGSTHVFSLLNMHPKIQKAIRKEPSWFIGRRHDFMDESVQQHMYFADYLLNFNPLNKKSEPALLVDGSVGMMLDWPDFFNQQRIVNYCLLPSVFPQVLPRAKFVVVMREPLSMLYSLFWFSYTELCQQVPSRDAQLKAPTLFHGKIAKKIRDINSCIEVFPLAKCLVESSPTSELLTNALPDQGGISLYESVYYIHIQKWLSVVPRERFLFLTMEELSTNVDHVANDIWNFVGVDSLHNSRATINKYAYKNEQKIIDYQHDPHLAMRKDTKKLLRSFLRPYNHMLAELLGDRKFLWED